MKIEFLDNTIGVELGENVQPNRYSKMPIYVTCEKITVRHYDGMLDQSQKKSETEISKAVLSELLKM